MTSGLDTMTSGVSKPRKRTLNASPWRRRHASMKEIGRTSQCRVCSAEGVVGPGGRAVTATEWQVPPRYRPSCSAYELRYWRRTVSTRLT